MSLIDFSKGVTAETNKSFTYDQSMHREMRLEFNPQDIHLPLPYGFTIGLKESTDDDSRIGEVRLHGTVIYQVFFDSHCGIHEFNANGELELTQHRLTQSANHTWYFKQADSNLSYTDAMFITPTYNRCPNWVQLEMMEYITTWLLYQFRYILTNPATTDITKGTYLDPDREAGKEEETPVEVDTSEVLICSGGKSLSDESYGYEKEWIEFYPPMFDNVLYPSKSQIDMLNMVKSILTERLKTKAKIIKHWVNSRPSGGEAAMLKEFSPSWKQYWRNTHSLWLEENLKELKAYHAEDTILLDKGMVHREYHRSYTLISRIHPGVFKMKLNQLNDD